MKLPVNFFASQNVEDLTLPLVTKVKNELASSEVRLEVYSSSANWYRRIVLICVIVHILLILAALGVLATKVIYYNLIGGGMMAGSVVVLLIKIHLEKRGSKFAVAVTRAGFQWGQWGELLDDLYENKSGDIEERMKRLKKEDRSIYVYVA